LAKVFEKGGAKSDFWAGTAAALRLFFFFLFYPFF